MASTPNEKPPSLERCSLVFDANAASNLRRAAAESGLRCRSSFNTMEDWLAPIVDVTPSAHTQ